MKTLDEKRIAALLALPKVRVEARETLPSTNDACRRLLSAGAGECLVLAERQTGGRGRRGRAFFSPPGGLYMSVAFPAAPDELGLKTYHQVTFYNDYKRHKIVGYPNEIPEATDFWRDHRNQVEDIVIIEWTIRVTKPSLCDFNLGAE